MNKIDAIFAKKRHSVLNIFCTAGYPKIDSLKEVMPALQKHGADIIEVGIPYSDPIADGPVIQQSNMQALQNGMNIQLLFQQLNALKSEIDIPVILMGYINPVMQYGIERFCEDAAAAGVSGVILPDLPMYEYENVYQEVFKKNKLHFIFLVGPHTSNERIKKAAALSKGFLYAVSSSATTGNTNIFSGQQAYFTKLKDMKLTIPILIGFGIKDKSTFDAACTYAAGAIIGSAYVKVIAGSTSIDGDTAAFINTIKEA